MVCQKLSITQLALTPATEGAVSVFQVPTVLVHAAKGVWLRLRVVTPLRGVYLQQALHQDVLQLMPGSLLYAKAPGS